MGIHVDIIGYIPRFEEQTIGVAVGGMAMPFSRILCLQISALCHVTPFHRLLLIRLGLQALAKDQYL